MDLQVKEPILTIKAPTLYPPQFALGCIFLMAAFASGATRRSSICSPWIEYSTYFDTMATAPLLILPRLGTPWRSWPPGDPQATGRVRKEAPMSDWSPSSSGLPKGSAAFVAVGGAAVV